MNNSLAESCLGCMSIAEISWMQRQVAKTLFGTPPSSSYEEALDHFQYAESLSPGFWKKNNLMIAKCYLHLHDPDVDNARLWLQKALAISTLTEEDEEAQAEAQALLKKLS